MEELIMYGAYGALGGLLRSILGLNKLRKSGVDIFKNFNVKDFIFSVVSSGVIGISAYYIVGMTGQNEIILAGYAGVDTFEGMIKTKK